MGLEEIQDNTGPTNDGTVAADQTLQKLVDAIAAAGGPAYRWREIDPTNDTDGGQPGGNAGRPGRAGSAGGRHRQHLHRRRGDPHHVRP